MITREELKSLADQYESLSSLNNATLVCPPNCQDKSPLPLPDSADYLHIQNQMSPIIQRMVTNRSALFILDYKRTAIAGILIARWEEIVSERKELIVSESELDLFEETMKELVEDMITSTNAEARLSVFGIESLLILLASFTGIKLSDFCFHDLFGLSIRSKGMNQVVIALDESYESGLDDELRKGVLLVEEWSKSHEATSNNNGLEVIDINPVLSIDSLLSLAPQLYRKFIDLLLYYSTKLVAVSKFIFSLDSMYVDPFSLLKALFTVQSCNEAQVQSTILSAFIPGPSNQTWDLDCFNKVELEMGYIFEIGYRCSRSTWIELKDMLVAKNTALLQECTSTLTQIKKSKAKAKHQQQKLDLDQLALNVQTLATTVASSTIELSALKFSISDSPSSSIQPLPDLSTTLSSNSSASKSTNRLSLPLETQENVIEEEVLVSLVADLDIQSSDDENMPGLDDASDTDSE